MKKKNLLFSFLIVTGISAFAQQSTPTAAAQIPANVKNTVTMLYPSATNVAWSQENGYFIPVFMNNGAQTKLLIDLKGARIHTSVKIAITELPANISSYITGNYPGKPISDVEKLTMFNNSTRYEAVVGQEDLIFDANGTFMKVAHGAMKQ